LQRLTLRAKVDEKLNHASMVLKYKWFTGPQQQYGDAPEIMESIALMAQ